jgi:molecular chaperone HtpG
MDKIYYKALSDESIAFNPSDYYIKITTDKENRILTISDTGIGMTKEELDDNLGVIAKSVSTRFFAPAIRKSLAVFPGQF